MPPGRCDSQGGKKWKLNTPGRSLRLKILALCWVYSAIRWVKGLAFPLGIGLEGLTDFLLSWFWRMVILGLLKICLGLRQWGSVLVWRACLWCMVVYQSTNWSLCRLLRFVHHERFFSACSLSWSTVAEVGFCSPSASMLWIRGLSELQWTRDPDFANLGTPLP